MSQSYQKKLKYQLSYFIRDVSIKNMLVDYNQNGDIALKHITPAFTFSHLIFICIGISGFIVNFLENYADLIYWFSGAFLVIYVLTAIAGYCRNKNDFFRFSPMNQIISYSIGISSRPTEVETSAANKWWCEIHDYRGHVRRSYSATFYHQNIENTSVKSIAFSFSSYYRHECIKVGNALNRYLDQMTELKDIRLIEK